MHSRTAFSGITLVLATNAIGCYSTWDIAPSNLTRLHGFRAGEERTIPTLSGENVTFSSSSEIQFLGTDGKEAQMSFQAIDFPEDHFVGEREKDGATMHVDLSRLATVKIRNVSEVKTGLTVAGIVVGGGGTLLGMGLLAALIGTTSGRPLRVAESDAPVRAPVFFDEPPRGRSQAYSSKGIDKTTRARLLAHWAHEASAECASIPAFWALARDLRRASAPTNLIRAALHAAREEATHTRLCVERAQAYAGTRARLVLPTTPHARDTSPEALLERLVLEAFWDGCIAEGAAAARARRSAQHATHEQTSLALQTIAQDEQRHADLAQDIIRFGLAHGGRSIRNALAESIEQRTREEEQHLLETNDMNHDKLTFDESLAHQHGLPRRNHSQDARIEVWERSRSFVASWMAAA